MMNDLTTALVTERSLGKTKDVEERILSNIKQFMEQNSKQHRPTNESMTTRREPRACSIW